MRPSSQRPSGPTPGAIRGAVEVVRHLHHLFQSLPSEANTPEAAPNGHSAADEEIALLFAEDLAEMFSIGLPAARKRLRLGQCGPYVRVGKRLAVLKTSFAEFLRRSQIGDEQTP